MAKAGAPSGGSLFWRLLGVLVLFIAVQIAIDADLLVFLLPYDDSATAFKGQIVWITGASSGIGAALALDLVKGGAQVIISARREKELAEVKALAATTYPSALEVDVFPLDVLDSSAQQRVYKAIIEKYKHIDVVVLNAGRSQRSLAMDFDVEQTRDLFNLNFFSYVSTSKLVVPDMQKRKSGKIVVMSSLAGKMGVTVSSSYSATKFALHGYFDGLRSEVSRDGISVLMVCPGPVKSEIVKRAMIADINTPSGPAAQSIVAEDTEKKMSTERCTLLVAKAMQWNLGEVWISQQPFLFVTYLAEYAPFLSRALWAKVLGPGRVGAMLSGGDLYDVKQLFKGVGVGQK